MALPGPNLKIQHPLLCLSVWWKGTVSKTGKLAKRIERQADDSSSHPHPLPWSYVQRRTGFGSGIRLYIPFGQLLLE